MAPTTSSGWAQLTTSTNSKRKTQCPKLFYNYFTPPEEGITLLLTDLISLWSCSLSDSDITATAAERQTSIDPSESREQMKVLLDKLETSLREGKNKLARRDEIGSKETILVLETSINLPKPLKPLEWTFTLLSQPASDLAEQVLRPTLRQLSLLQQKLQSMLDVVKDKDHVIERLLDRVAEKGVDMSLIFPTLTGMGKRASGAVKVEDARKLVPGMKSFERATWETSFNGDEEGAERNLLGLEELVRGCEKCFVHSKEDHDRWMDKLPSVQSLQNGTSTISLSKSQSQNATQQTGLVHDSESENEFETQATPPEFKKNSTGRSPDATTDEDDAPAANRPKTGKQRAKIGKIGKIGLRKASVKRDQGKAQETSTSPARQAHRMSSSPRRREPNASVATESATSDAESAVSSERKIRKGTLQQQKSPGDFNTQILNDRPPSPTGSARPLSNRSTPSRRLGRMRKAKEKPVAASPLSEIGEGVDESRNEQRSPTTTPSRKLGRLGMRKKAEQAGSRSRSQSPATQTRTERHADGKGRTRGSAIGQHDSNSDATASPPPSPSPSRPSATIARSLRDHPIDDSSRSNKQPLQAHTKQPTPTPIPSPIPEPETDDQMAARRRDELKRTIQATGPKKKRRF